MIIKELMNKLNQIEDEDIEIKDNYLEVKNDL